MKAAIWLHPQPLPRQMQFTEWMAFGNGWSGGTFVLLGSALGSMWTFEKRSQGVRLSDETLQCRTVLHSWGWGWG